MWVCIVFIYLNDACAKDSYPQPSINKLVGHTMGHKMFSLIDGYSSYNHIQLAQEDQEKTTFIIEDGVYCYNIMPFGLKNTGGYLPTTSQPYL